MMKWAKVKKDAEEIEIMTQITHNSAEIRNQIDWLETFQEKQLQSSLKLRTFEEQRKKDRK